jgi:hypothetical protein
MEQVAQGERTRPDLQQYHPHLLRHERDLRTFEDHHVQLVSDRAGDLIRPFVPSWEVFLVRLILDVAGDGDYTSPSRQASSERTEGHTFPSEKTVCVCKSPFNVTKPGMSGMATSVRTRVRFHDPLYGRRG